MLNALEWEGLGEQQFSSRTWASRTEIMRIKWLVPRASPSQKYRASAHMQLWLLASFTPLGFPSPCEPSIQALIWEAKQSEPTLRGAGGCRATPYFKVGAKTLLLKTEQGASETNPPQLEPLQSLSTPLAAPSRGNSALSHKIKLSLYSPF